MWCFYHGHCAPRTLREWPATWTGLRGTSILGHGSGGQDRIGHEGRRKYNEEEDRISCSKVFQRSPHYVMVAHHGKFLVQRPAISKGRQSECFHDTTSKVFRPTRVREVVRLSGRGRWQNRTEEDEGWEGPREWEGQVKAWVGDCRRDRHRRVRLRTLLLRL